ncbi:DUF438 domain-containing protein [Irregularibacter muris]|uniref:DUF438 domain-containing protein n=1 Tax=Irregularibacter muris TaxID=1796619 RepID=A0AAE3L2Z8_9FIRM|nr:DUF438 domain-containing protein [Irregularibacter muris]MCR1899609.1 DUF438 domain-containing protein [Irregularibacter muris]
MDNKRIEKLTTVLERLNTEGVTEELRKEALDIVSNIDPIELSIAEQKLIEGGMDPQNLRHLCDVHMEVLKDELESMKTKIEPGHVIDTLIIEHEKIKEFLTELEEINFKIQKMQSKDEDSEIFKKLLEVAEQILDAENHHKREEDVLFPEMEKRNITGPTRIMRMEHDDLRNRKKVLKDAAENVETMDFELFQSTVDETAKYIIFNLRDHIYKENYILYPTAIDAIQEKELWKDMKNRCDQVGYCGFTPNL